MPVAACECAAERDSWLRRPPHVAMRAVSAGLGTCHTPGGALKGRMRGSQHEAPLSRGGHALRAVACAACCARAYLTHLRQMSGKEPFLMNALRQLSVTLGLETSSL